LSGSNNLIGDGTDQTLENGVPGLGYYVKNFGKIDTIVSPALDQVWRGEKTAEEALNEIADKAQAEVQGRY
jgi:multiple sugar transport system substrate-binding protein